jgi:hypothetical protein
MQQGIGDNRVYTVAKMIDLGTTLTSTTSAPGLYAFAFKLADLSEYTSFTSIFDQYRIDSVEITILPQTIPSTTSSASVPFANLAVVTDYDDASALANWALHLNYQNVQVISPGQRHKRKIIPHAQSAQVTLGSTVNTFSLARPWIDCSNVAVQHFGFKVGVQQSTSSNVSLWYPYFRYTVSFRNVR